MDLKTRAVLMIMASLVGVVFVACAPSDDDDGDSGDDDSSDCRALGVPFEPPAGVTDPWKLAAGDYCCDGGNAITIAEEMTSTECTLMQPLQFVCIAVNGDCDTGENFCLDTYACTPPNGFQEECCGEGDRCWTENEWDLPPSGIVGCCSGLDEVAYNLPLSDGDGCSGPTGEYDIICVLDCGDGECTVGENPCNCPEDCPVDSW